jgi:predicted membrane-bound spermidine synthase
MKLKLIIIFIAGAIILSLELLSSRVMTPYFGVSLYIWTGILSITLAALSLGYYWGGKLSHPSASTDNDQGEETKRLEGLFFLMPARASIAIPMSCLIYPFLFYKFAAADLVLGAFMASIVMLLIPLATISAMNPILIAIEHAREQRTHAGKSSGRVFFISTIGSVTGVILTSFILIPRLTNFSAILALGIILSLIPLIASSFSKSISQKFIKQIRVASLMGLTFSITLLILSPMLLNKKDTLNYAGQSWKMKAEYSSVFGGIKVVEVNGNEVRYYTNGALQSIADKRGHSRLPYTYGMEALAIGSSPEARTALVIGLAAGVVPMRLAKRGLTVDVVEINPYSLMAAKKYFFFNDTKVKVHLKDARTFVKDCSDTSGYDLVLIDTPQGDGFPEYLLTREFFTDVKSCLATGGVLAMNTLTDRRFADEYYPIVKTLNSVFKNVSIFYEENAPVDWPFTVHVAATDKDISSPLRINFNEYPIWTRRGLMTSFHEPRPINEALLKQTHVLTDEKNTYGFQTAGFAMEFRRATILGTPPEFLVN